MTDENKLKKGFTANDDKIMQKTGAPMAKGRLPEIAPAEQKQLHAGITPSPLSHCYNSPVTLL
jgi:hypothetical protein